MSKWYRYVVIALSAIIVVLVWLLADTAASLAKSNEEVIRLGDDMYEFSYQAQEAHRAREQAEYDLYVCRGGT